MYSIHTPAGLTAAKQWTQNLLSILKPGGSWAVPRSGSVYTFNQPEKTYTVVGESDGAIDTVLKELGYNQTKPQQ